jgi:GxxExxY protein
LLTRQVIGAAIEVHRHLGPGLLESSHQKCLEYKLLKKVLSVKRAVPVSILYKELLVENGYRIDLWVNSELV